MALPAAPSFLKLPFDEVVQPFLDHVWHYDCIVSPTYRHLVPCISSEELLEPVAAASEHAPSAPCSPDATAVDTAAGGDSTPRCGNGTVTRGGVPSCGQTLHESADSPRLESPEVDAQTLWLRNVFDTFDENRDGTLTTDELRRSLGKLGIEATDESVLSLLRSTPLNEDGYVDVDEFLFLYNSVCASIDNYFAETDACANGDEDLLEAFNVFDKDKDGFISPEELQFVLCDLGFRQAQELEACVEMIKRADQDGDGRVDFDEFKRLMVRSAAIAS